MLLKVYYQCHFFNLISFPSFHEPREKNTQAAVSVSTAIQMEKYNGVLS